MFNFIKLYKIIQSADELSNFKGWVYLLYYPIMKELDSMNRHLCHYSVKSYSRKLVDEFYYGFGLYDHRLPAIGIEEFCSILKNTTSFIPSPLKKYIPSTPNLNLGNYIINYHDASPCFYSMNKSFRVIVNTKECHIDINERTRIIEFILEETLKNNLVDILYKDILRIILGEYVRMAAEKYPKIISWLEIVANSNINLIVTDQTLAPAQCFVNHVLKSRGKKLVVLQHQKNMFLTDIFPLVFLDLSISDVYYSWFSHEFMYKNYGEYMSFINTEFVQAGVIKIKQINPTDVLECIETGKTCLLILNAVEEKFIKGTMNPPYGYVDNIAKVINLIKGLHYKAFLRKDPRSNMTIDNIEEDNSQDLMSAIHKYDVCVCDRPGGAAVTVLEEKGFVFIRFDNSEFKKTHIYSKLQEKGNLLKTKMSRGRDIINSNIDLLIS